MKKIISAIINFLATIAETIVSAVIVAVLYFVYLPFGIMRAIFNRKAIRGFFDDVMWAIDGIKVRISKRESAE